MGTPKLSSFAISMIWVAFFAVVFSAFISEFANKYDAPIDVSDIESFDRLEQLRLDAAAIQTSTEISEPSGIFDIIGGYFSSAYNALRTATGSIDVFFTLFKNFLNSTSIVIPFGNELLVAITSTVIILIFVGVLISAIVKKDV